MPGALRERNRAAALAGGEPPDSGATPAPKRARRRPLPTPGSQAKLTPNDDAREREQSRRRRSAVAEGRALEDEMEVQAAAVPAAAAPPRPPSARALDAAAVAALYQNCLKLASENKITAKNTWALPLIDHMSDLVAAGPGGEDGDGPGGGTDFQRASLTLAAGVSIYAHRVDAVHGDVFRILGGLGRPTGGGGGGGEDGEGEAEKEGGGGEDGEDGGEGGDGDANARRGRRGRGAAASDPGATLAPREDITAPQFDLAFAVDPLFQRTAAQFDEGGAAGLLLAGLPLDAGCCLAFDSTAVPDVRRGGGAAAPPSLGPALDGWEAVAPTAAAALARLAMAAPDPALAELLKLGGGPAAAGARDGEADALVARVVAGLGLGGGGGVAAPPPPAAEAEWEPADLGGGGPDDDDDDDDDAGYVDAADHLSAGLSGGLDGGDGGGEGGPRAPDWLAGGSGSLPTTPAAAARDSAATATEDALRWLVAGGAALPEGGAAADGAPPPTHGRAWAGVAAHWRHRAARGRGGAGGTPDGGPPGPVGGSGRPLPPPRSSRAAPIDFTSLPALAPDALRRAPARETTLRGGLKPGAVPPADTLLPDDLHCEPAGLGRLFLAPECPPAAAAAAAAAGGRGGAGAAAAAAGDASVAGSPAGGGGGGWGDGGFGGDDDDDDGVALPDGFGAGGTPPAPAGVAAGAGLPADAAGVLGPGVWGGGGGGGGDAAPAIAPAARLASGPPIAYTRTAKQVDVRLLKEALWEAATGRAEGDGAIPLSALVADVCTSATGRAAAPPGQLSPHLVFICLLHLCNEHSLALGREGGRGPAEGAAAPAARLGGGADLVVAGVKGGA